MIVKAKSPEKIIFANRYGLVESLNSLLHNLQAYYSVRLNIREDVPEEEVEDFQNKLENIRLLNRTPEVFENDILMQELIDEYSPIMKAINVREISLHN